MGIERQSDASMRFLADLFRLDGRTAVVTGGTSGIGRSVAEALGRAGARVVLVARREGPLANVAEELSALGLAVKGVSADLSDRDGVALAAVTASEPFGDPDILVNSAGVNLRPPLERLTDDEWDRTIAVNLSAPFLLGQRFGPRMAERGWGRIMNIGSQQAIRAFGNSGAYGVSKAGLAALTRSQAEAWSRHGVCVNSIAPGFVKTPLTRDVFADPQRTQALLDRTMTGRHGEPSDFQGAAVFLASDASSHVTGQTLFVDGGFSST